MKFKSILVLFFTLLLCSFLLFRCAIDDSVTYDEPLHIASAKEWITNYNSPTDPFNPPLAKLPALFTQEILQLRTVSIVYTLTLLVLVFLWANKKINEKFAMIVVVILGFEPTVLGHGHLFTTDILATIAIFFAFATYDLWPKWHWLSLVLMLWIKTTLLPIWLLFLVYQFFYDFKKLKEIYFSLKMFPVIFSLLLIGEIIIHDASYVFNPKFSSTHTFMLFENLSNSGWVHYPFIVLLVKLSPLLFLSLLSFNRKFMPIIILALSVVAVVAIGRYNTGVRHLLPAFPFIAVLAANTVSRLPNKLLIILLFIHVFISFTVIDPIAYFNPIVGSDKGGRMIVESNLDIGQSLNRAKKDVDFSKIDFVLTNNFNSIEIIGDIKDKRILISRTLWYTKGYYLDLKFNQKKQTLIAGGTMILLE